MSGTKLSHMSGIPVSHERDAAGTIVRGRSIMDVM
jgi:hypothetical protein